MRPEEYEGEMIDPRSETPQEAVTRWLDEGSAVLTTPPEVREAIRAVLAENALHKRWHRKPTHGPCCTCQKCGQDYDTCRCSLDDVADELQRAEAERDALRSDLADIVTNDEGRRGEVARLSAEIERLRDAKPEPFSDAACGPRYAEPKG